MNDFDQAARYAARLLDPAGFLRWLLSEVVWLAWRWGGWLDTQSVPFPGEPDRRSDTVAWFERLAGDWPPMAVVIEFMSRARRLTPERLAEYGLRLRRELPYQFDPRVDYDVVGVLVNLTGRAGQGEWAMTPPDCGGLGLWTRVGVRNLADVSARDTLAAVARGEISRCLLAWVPLMEGAAEADVVTEWRRLVEGETDSRLRGDYVGLALVFASLVDRLGVWQTGLEGLNVERSEVALEWEARGEARGELKRLKVALSRVLQVKFGDPLAEDMAQAIQAQTTLAILDAWFNRALTAHTLNEVRQILGLDSEL